MRALLAALLLEGGRIISVESLTDVLWGGAPPASARASLHNHVARLRRLLDDPERLRAVPPGYVLRVNEGELDVDVFVSRVAAARAAHAGRDWERTLHECGAALALWRGTPLSGLPAEVGGFALVQRLREARLLLLEWRYDAELAVGGPRLEALVPELTALAVEYPLRESFHRHLMLALHRTGRRAEALAVHRDLRTRLIEELGVEPGAGVREAHVEVLREGPENEPGRATPAPVEGVVGGSGRGLRGSVGGAVGGSGRGEMGAAVEGVVGGSGRGLRGSVGGAVGGSGRGEMGAAVEGVVGGSGRGLRGSVGGAVGGSGRGEMRAAVESSVGQDGAVPRGAVGAAAFHEDAVLRGAASPDAAAHDDDLRRPAHTDTVRDAHPVPVPAGTPTTLPHHTPDTPATPPHEAQPRPPRPAQLPPPPAHFTGRAAVLHDLSHTLAPAPALAPASDSDSASARQRPRTATVAVISGMAGVGKSALALQAAHGLANRFPDGQLYVNLHGATPGMPPLTPGQALIALLRDLGASPRSIPEHPDAATALLRSLLAPTRTLMVLDDAANAAQVRPLLPAGPGCAVIVTSRSPLTALDGVRRFPLTPLTAEDSAALLRAASGRDGAMDRATSLDARDGVAGAAGSAAAGSAIEGRAIGGPAAADRTEAHPTSAGAGAHPASAGAGAHPASAGAGAHPASAGAGAHLASAGAGTGTEARPADHHPVSHPPTTPAIDAVHPLVQLTGGLPLALRIVAARLAARRALTPEVLARQLAATESRLHHLEYDDLSVRRSLAVAHDALAASDREADRDAALVLRRIGAVDLPTYGAPLLARLTGTDERRAEAALDRLVDVALLEETAYGRYAPHDLVRDFARELAEPDGDFTETALRWYAAVAERALTAIVEPGLDRDDRRRPTPTQPADHPTTVDTVSPFDCSETAFAWGDLELENVVALAERHGGDTGTDNHTDTGTDHHTGTGTATATATGTGPAIGADESGALTPAADSHTPTPTPDVSPFSGALSALTPHLSTLIRLLFPYLQRSGRVAEMEVLGQAALRIARRLGDDAAEAYALVDLAGLYFLTGRQTEALHLNDRSLAIWRRLGVVSWMRRCLNNRGLLLESLGRHAESGQALRQSLEYSRQLNDPYGEAVTYSHLGNLYEHTDPRAAIEQHHRSLTIGDEIGNVIVQHSAHCNIGYAHLTLGEPAAAAAHFEESLRILGGHGDWHGESQTRLGLVRALRLLGRTDRAGHECADLLRRAEARADRYTGGLARHQRGLLLRDGGRVQEAYAEWRKALDALDGTDAKEVVQELGELLDAADGR
ncbi:BTAD domain-containing putative transcriptional regulator [Streptomyces sp. HD]|nr:BTAD domain-containing putative transcriptional regulator [Streptomyces sp. HD]MDC0770724.1 BTAD domain-containing putative transcriptional regulator [Streptomyces sp. HD]